MSTEIIFYVFLTTFHSSRQNFSILLRFLLYLFYTSILFLCALLNFVQFIHHLPQETFATCYLLLLIVHDCWFEKLMCHLFHTSVCQRYWWSCLISLTTPTKLEGSWEEPLFIIQFYAFPFLSTRSVTCSYRGSKQICAFWGSLKLWEMDRIWNHKT